MKSRHSFVPKLRHCHCHLVILLFKNENLCNTSSRILSGDFSTAKSRRSAAKNISVVFLQYSKINNWPTPFNLQSIITGNERVIFDNLTATYVVTSYYIYHQSALSVFVIVLQTTVKDTHYLPTTPYVYELTKFRKLGLQLQHHSSHVQQQANERIIFHHLLSRPLLESSTAKRQMS